MTDHSLDNKLSKYSTSKDFSAQENIFTYDDKAKKVYIILDGLIQLFIQQEEKEKEIARLESGDIFGEIALLAKKKRSARAQTAQKSRLLVFSPDNLKDLMQQEPILNENIINALCNRVHRLEQKKITLPPLNQGQTTEEDTQDKQNQKKEEKNKDKTQKVKKMDLNNQHEFYLQGHKKYNLSIKSNFNKYTYQKEITCPVCNTDFTVQKVRNSKLRLKEIRDDLRPIYKTFKPLWYKIWSCPNCFYTARKKDYFDFSSRQERKIKKEFKEKIQSILGSDYQPSYSQPRKIDEIFDAYYLALKLYHLIDARKDKVAYLWLRLNWLYEDVEEEELAEIASFKAMQNLEEFYFESDALKLSRSQEDKLTLLLALLLAKHEKKDKALPLLDNLIRSPQTKHRQKQLARDKFIELRREKKKEAQNN